VVAENARRRGVGQKLWEALVKVAREKKCQLIKWQVLDWNEPAREFYKRQGAELESGWENGKLFLQYP
jgi:ribosomal protein S18 acetylase RimI-like enzyme